MTLGNVPFVATPTLATSIYLSVFLKSRRLDTGVGNASVFLAGIAMILCTYRPISNAIRYFMPKAMRIGICVGLSLLIALRALEHLDIAVPGDFTILEMGNIWRVEVIIAMATFILVGSLIHYEVKGAYIIGMAFSNLG